MGHCDEACIRQGKKKPLGRRINYFNGISRPKYIDNMNGLAVTLFGGDNLFKQSSASLAVTSTLGTDDKVLKDYAQEALGYDFRSKNITTLEKAVTKPAEYVEARDKKIKNVYDKIGPEAFAAAYKAYSGEDWPELVKRKMAANISNTAVQQAMQAIELTHPRDVARLAGGLAHKKATTETALAMNALGFM